MQSVLLFVTETNFLIPKEKKKGHIHTKVI